MCENSHSRYCYPGTEILQNIPGFRTQLELDQYEKNVTADRLLECSLKPIRGKFDFRHLRVIHRYIFQDVYLFAGKIRDEAISKGGFPFCNPQFITSQADNIFNNLKGDKYLVGMAIDEFFEKLAYYMAEINVLHPFREGNGRAQREFIRCLALRSGYKLDWSKVGSEEITTQTILSVYDYKALVPVLKSAQ